ncbi:MAG: hypothetical protein PQJ46_15310 [Spirochaetales bacterium]|nr:hypothetical protein [Spirochaetales bacterium]
MIKLPCKKPELYNYSIHKERMLLIDQIDSYNLSDCTIETSVFVNNNSEFLSNNKIASWISFEYMAQNIALLSTITHQERGEKPEIGFIMNVRDFIAHESFFSLGDSISIEVEQTFREGNIAVFEGRTIVQGKCYTSGIVSVAESTDEIISTWKKK